MKRILLSAYACLPNNGSEEENGWNYATLLSKENIEVHCITQAKWKKSLDPAMATGCFPNLTFHYVDVPAWLEKQYGNLIGMYFHYLYWQWQAAKLAIRLDRNVIFDLIHHVTYGSIQLGSFMYRVGKPFVFGPVGGGQQAPRVLKAYFGPYWWREKVRDWISVLLQYVNPGFYKTMKYADRVLVSNEETFRLARRFRPEKPIDRVLDSVIGASFLPPDPIRRRAGKTLKLVWVGRLMPRKGLELVIQSLSKVNPDLPITLTIVGGKGQMADQVPHYIERYGVADRVQWVGHVPFADVKKYYEESDVFFFTSLRDSGPMQLVEAMAYSLPVVTIAIHGQNQMVNERNGIKIPVTTTDQVTRDLARAVEWLYHHPNERARMGKAAYAFAREQVWEKKISEFTNELYPALITREPPRPAFVNK